MTQVQPWDAPPSSGVDGTTEDEPKFPLQRQPEKSATHRRSRNSSRHRDQDTVLALQAALASRHGFVAPLPTAHVLSGPQRAAKRALDIVGALALLVATSPLILVAGMAVVATSRGPVLYVQHRVGRGGKHFRMYKLRSMRVNGDDRQHREYVALFLKGEAAAENGVFKLVKDPRITRAGRGLRRFSIDELPQLWNVLRGDMSLVGPRPALPHEVELYDDHAHQRLAVQPGLTGLWQVSGRCRLSFAEMVDLDIHYWRTWSLASDVRILLKTPKAALSGSGAA